MTAELDRHERPPAVIIDHSDNPLALIRQAIDRGFAADQLKILLDLYNAEKANQAREAYAEAMHRVQQNTPVIVKNKKGDKSNYAPLENIEAIVKPILGSEGFSLSFGQMDGAPEGYVRMALKITHKLGHHESTWMDVARDDTSPKGAPNAMTPPQRSGSTASYAQRYLLCKALNITVAGEDTDAARRADTWGPDEIGKVNDLCDECRAAGCPVDFAKLLAWLKVENLDDAPKSRFPDAVSFLQRKLSEARNGKVGAK